MSDPLGTVYAIKNPEGMLITWTCYRSKEQSWLTYMDLERMTEFGKKRMKELERAGYQVVPVTICETEPAK